MAQLLLRGECLGDFDGVLFDKDGTLSHSEPRLIEQGHSRIAAAWNVSARKSQPPASRWSSSKKMMQQAYGLSQESVSPDGTAGRCLTPAQHLVATATVFTLLGLSGPVLC